MIIDCHAWKPRLSHRLSPPSSHPSSGFLIVFYALGELQVFPPSLWGCSGAARWSLRRPVKQQRRLSQWSNGGGRVGEAAVKTFLVKKPQRLHHWSSSEETFSETKAEAQSVKQRLRNICWSSSKGRVSEPAEEDLVDLGWKVIVTGREEQEMQRFWLTELWKRSEETVSRSAGEPKEPINLNPDFLWYRRLYFNFTVYFNTKVFCQGQNKIYTIGLWKIVQKLSLIIKIWKSWEARQDNKIFTIMAKPKLNFHFIQSDTGHCRFQFLSWTYWN